MLVLQGSAGAPQSYCHLCVLPDCFYVVLPMSLKSLSPSFAARYNDCFLRCPFDVPKVTVTFCAARLLQCLVVLSMSLKFMSPSHATRCNDCFLRCPVDVTKVCHLRALPGASIIFHVVQLISLEITVTSVCCQLNCTQMYPVDVPQSCWHPRILPEGLFSRLISPMFPKVANTLVC